MQEAVLKPATEGLDLIGRARTGTGKTLAFGIPIIQNLLEQNQNSSWHCPHNPHVLLLAAIRELAMQLENNFMEPVPTLSTLCVYEGVLREGQQRKLQSGVEIAVGTLGRIMSWSDACYRFRWRYRENLRKCTYKSPKYVVFCHHAVLGFPNFQEILEESLDDWSGELLMIICWRQCTQPTWVGRGLHCLTDESILLGWRF